MRVATVLDIQYQTGAGCMFLGPLPLPSDGSLKTYKLEWVEFHPIGEVLCQLQTQLSEHNGIHGSSKHTHESCGDVFLARIMACVQLGDKTGCVKYKL